MNRHLDSHGTCPRVNQKSRPQTSQAQAYRRPRTPMPQAQARCPLSTARHVPVAPDSPYAHATRTRCGIMARKHPDNGRLPFVVAAAAIACIAIIGGQALTRGALPNTAMHAATENTLDGQETEATSTPVDEWRQGEVPELYQIDRAWADEPYAGGDIRENGCGPTCLSMVYVALTGRTDLDPAAMARFSEEAEHVTDNMTAWTLMTDGAAQLGLTSEELPADADAVRNALTAGQPVICSVRPGDFTKTGHFIVLAGLDAEGRVIVHDPNSAARTAQPWDLERILSQCANLWAFSLAY